MTCWHTHDETHRMFLKKLERRGVTFRNCDSGFFDHKRRYGFMIEVDGKDYVEEVQLETAGILPKNIEIHRAVHAIARAAGVPESAAKEYDQ